MEKRVLVLSDVHLCRVDWYGRSSEDRMEKMIADLNDFTAAHKTEAIFFLGDYSLDFWVCCEGGSFLNEGKSNAKRFYDEYAKRLNVPFYMIPGNHEQYGNENWKKITGNSRRFSFTSGGWLFIGCDNFSGDLDPKEHSDGTYTPTDLAFVKKCMDEHPDLPVILCAHYFDTENEPDEFFEFLKNEKRITLLICGHDHCSKVDELGERAGGLCLYHDGHYSYAGGGRDPKTVMWGFCELLLDEDSCEIVYREPDNTVTLHGESYTQTAREQNRRRFKTR